MLPELARRLVVWLAQELMGAEVTAAVGAA
jgi:putative transposase